MKNFGKTTILALGVAPLTALALENGNFENVNARADGDLNYTSVEGVGFFPSWTILSDDGGFIRTEEGFGANGHSAFAFNILDTGYGANKIEQCIPIDPSQSLLLSYSILTTVASDDVRTRLNPNFYPDMAACETNLQVDDNSNRLSFDGSNDDFNQQLGQAGIDANEWFEISPVVFSADDLPDEARVLRISLRARDRSEENAQVFFDDVRVTQGESNVNLVRNGDFSHTDLTDGDFITGDSGWYLDREEGLRAAAGAFSFAQAGSNLFYFESLTGNFGTSRLDQCVELNGEDNIRPSLRAMSLTPDEELNIRVDVSFFTDALCTEDADSALSLREDFAIDGESGEWLTLVSEEFREAAAVVDATSARISIRARDRSVGEDDVSPAFARTLYVDDVTLASTVPAPTFNPPSQEFTADELVVTLDGPEGSTLYVTTDGSDPTQSSMALLPGETVSVTETTTISVIAVMDGESSGIRSATYTRSSAEDAPFVPPSEPLDRSAGGIGSFFAIFGLIFLIRERLAKRRAH
ncbi:chitobiase/beta-hexosaminidase C-terminal domain-containing protein [Marinimicrobium alkaliphilum]|uniref:chitobiase/beta-hexosaminidase C-terminal domain-containing protein n=1 Tax=Marinimicrobium alkaliphilum TaxID=2202654 RepID=UPI000DB9B3E2|nr:chitobiase/beta-hexosaminidase C-terminal domain-containing protein [Marinimicrobium alkaliphilum]